MSWTGVLILRIVINLTAVRIFRSSVIKRSQCLHSKPRLVRPLELWKVYFAASVCGSDNPVSFTPKAKNKYWLSMRRIILRCLQSTRLQTHSCLDKKKNDILVSSTIARACGDSLKLITLHTTSNADFQGSRMVKRTNPVMNQTIDATKLFYPKNCLNILAPLTFVRLLLCNCNCSAGREN